MQGRQGIRPLTVAALDIGGTHVAGGRVDVASASVDPGSRVRVPLPDPDGRDGLLDAIIRVAQAIARPDTNGLGLAVPGPFDYCTGISRITHKLGGLYGVDLRSELSTALALADPAQVRFLNDAAAFLLGEWWVGAGRGHARVVGITLGTGLGAAFLEDGRILRSGTGVPPGGTLYQLQFRGAPVEESISSRGLVASYGASGVDVEQVATRAKAGELAAARCFDQLGRALGEFMLPWLERFEPSCLVVGGSIARSWELLEGGLRAALAPIEGLETVTVAEQLEDAPLLGAAWYAASERL